MRDDDPVFIHIPKTGGSYLRRTLEKSGVRFISAAHKGASVLTTNHPRFGDINFHGRFSFACVRNPYERFLSACRFGRHIGNYPVDFERKSVDLILGLEGRRGSDRRPHFQTQKSMVVDSDGEIIVKYIGRYEQFNEFIQGLAEHGLDVTSLYEFKQHKSVDWESTLTEATKENIRELYEEDFTLFGYDF